MKNRIKLLRKHFGFTQEKFSKRINRTAGFIGKVETGRCNASDETIHAICSAFGVREEWLINGTGEMLEKEHESVDLSGIGSRIRQVRNGLTQQEFADKIGFHKNQVYYVEKGKIIPSDEFLSKVSKVFDTNLNWLKTGVYRENDKVDEELIEWLNENPDIITELRMRMKPNRHTSKDEISE